MILGLHLDRSGRLWIASSLGGLSRVDDTSQPRPAFTTYTTAQGLASNRVLSLTEDRWGRIYAGTGRGIDRIDVAHHRITHYGESEGVSAGTSE
ncbi:MAG: two-component regulator propeller domain-containing protein [Bryobacteraceae bacterium]